MSRLPSLVNKKITTENHRKLLDIAEKRLRGMKGMTLDILELPKPPDTEYEVHLLKVLSKISPFVANMIELQSIRALRQLEWTNGRWIRQDPGFPDLFFDCKHKCPPGIEIKTWFPLATEITARFRDSQTRFVNGEIDVAVIAWLPEHILYGKPKIIDVWIGTAKSLAEARDKHYHSPPDYIVLEPEDTSKRTRNLQQTNTKGYKFQGDNELLIRARKEVASWGPGSKIYKTTPQYQAKLKRLRDKYSYREESNYAKIDRIAHPELERFKTSILKTVIEGRTVAQWIKLTGADKETTEKQLEIDH